WPVHDASSTLMVLAASASTPTGVVDTPRLPSARRPGATGHRHVAEQCPDAEVVAGLDAAGDHEWCPHQVGLDEQTGEQRADGANGISGAVGVSSCGGALVGGDDGDDVCLSGWDVHLG